MTSLFRHQHPRYTRPGAFVGLLLMLAFALGLSACSGNGSISTDNGTGTTTAGDTATATTASLTPTVVAATTPVPTATTHPGGGAPTATPIPVLQGQVVTQGLGSIGANTNSSIVDVACPSGFLVAGGGVSSGYANFTTMESAPISTTKFRAEIYNQNSSAISAQVQVMCLKVAALQGQVVVQGLGSIGANTNSSIVDVACPSGFLNAGGGIASGYANFTTMETAPISTTKFRAEIYNQNSSAISAQVQVSCLKLG